MKIVGNTVGTTMPRPNLMQNDPQKGDYVKGKEEFKEQLRAELGKTDTTLTEADKQEIAELAAQFVDVPEVDLSGYAKRSEIPSKTSQLQNDNVYATEEYVANKIAEAELSGGDVDLSGYAWKSEIPKKVSQLDNDKGYLESVPMDNALNQSGVAADAKAVGDALTYAGRNLASTSNPYLRGGNVDARWQTIILPYKNNVNTWIRIATTENLVQGEQYVLSFDCTGVPADTQGKKFGFWLGEATAQSYATLTNGKVVVPFTAGKYDYSGSVLLDDRKSGSWDERPTESLVGDGVFLSNFCIEKGSFSLGYQHKYPVLTTEQKNQIQALAKSYFDVGYSTTSREATFHYDTNVVRNDFANSRCHNPRGKCDSFALCCNTFVEMVWMGRAVSDFFGKTKDTYSNNITKAFDWGYYFDFNDRKRIGGLFSRNENGEIVGYYSFKNPNEDKTNFKNSYSTNSYFDYSLTDSEAIRAKFPKLNWFRPFMHANDVAQELYRMGCEIPFEELDIGDLVFTRPRHELDTEAETFFNNMCWKNIGHVVMVYDKAADGTLKFIDCTNHYDDYRQCIYTSSTGYTEPGNDFYTAEDGYIFYTSKAIEIMSNIVMCARHPAAWGKSNMANIDRIDYIPMYETTGYSTGQAIPFTSGMAVTEGLWYVCNNELGKALTTGNAAEWSATYFDIQYANNG